MKKKMRLFGILVVLMGLVAVMTTGCGKKNVSLLDTVEVNFSGMDGYGTAYITGEDDWIETVIGNEGTDLEKLGAYVQLKKAVKFSLSETEDLSNGDKLELTVKVDEEVLKEYGFKVKETTKVVVVEGLEEPKEFDPFSVMTVNVTGTAPNGQLDMRFTESPLYGLHISADKTEGLKNGDVITFTLNNYDGEDVMAFAKQQGYALTRTTMQYTVSGINSYISSLDQIPAATLEKMKAQTESAIDTVFADGQPQNDEYSTYTNVTQLLGKEYAGAYIFTLKDGYKSNYAYPANMIYIIYKVTATSTDGEFSYYYALRFQNGMLMEGKEFTLDLSDYDKTDAQFTKGYYTYTGKYFGSSNYDQSYYGYQDMDDFKQKEIMPLVERYSYATNMQ